MARSKSSRRWLNEHFDDPYVLQSQKDGYRGRAGLQAHGAAGQVPADSSR